MMEYDESDVFSMNLTTPRDLITFSSPKNRIHPIPKLEFGSIIDDSVLAKPRVPSTPIDDTSRFLNADILDDDTECDFKEYNELDDMTDRSNMVQPLVLLNEYNMDQVPTFQTSPTGTGQTMLHHLYSQLNEKCTDLDELQEHIQDMGDEADNLKDQVRKLKQENYEIKNDCLEALDENFKLQNKALGEVDTATSMEQPADNQAENASENDEDQTRSVTTMSLLNHEKELLIQKTKTQENEIMGLRLKVEALEKDKQDVSKNLTVGFTYDDKESLEREISALRGKVALLERNNRIFSNQERKELKQELERTKRRYNNMNEQYTKVKNSIEYNHVDDVEKSLEDYATQVKVLTKENNDLRKGKRSSNSEVEISSSQIIEEKEETIKDQDVLIDELQHRIESMKIRSIQEAENRLPVPTTPSRNTSAQTDQDDNKETSSENKTRLRSDSRNSRSLERITSSSRRGSISRKVHSARLDSESEQGSDSDARAIRAMSSRMRQDIEEARQKLRDMGEALDVSQHVSPIRFPLKLQLSDIISPRKSHEDVVDSELKHYTANKSNLKAMSSPETHGRERSKSESARKLKSLHTSFAHFDGTSSWSAGMQLPVPRDSTDSDKLATLQFDAEREKKIKRKRKTFIERKKKQKQQKDVDVNKIKLTSESNRARLTELLGEYELLRVQSLDYKILEVENECVRVDYLKLQHEDAQRRKNSKKKQNTSKVNEFENKYESKENDHDDVKLQPKQLIKSKYLPEEHNYEFTQPVLENLQKSPYRVYVAKNNSFPMQSVSEKIDKTSQFSELPLRIGDVAISLGAPETRGDGKKYQLAEVNGVIGFVPYSHLQQAEHVHGMVADNHFKTNSNLLKTLRRLPDVYKKVHDRRREMCYGM